MIKRNGYYLQLDNLKQDDRGQWVITDKRGAVVCLLGKSKFGALRTLVTHAKAMNARLS